MAEKSGIPEWFLWVLEKRLFGVLALVAVLAVVILIFQLDSMVERLDQIEDRLVYEPAKDYTPPNLEDYSANGVTAQGAILRGAVYVPIYSHVYYHSGRPYLLEATLSIRNTDSRNPAYVDSVRYYNTKGELVKIEVDSPIRLDPLETIEFLVEVQDTVGGSGANFIVEWFAVQQINQPLIEAVMVGATGTQGVAFTSTGQPIELTEE
jgi:hypothetical protein